MKINSSIKLFIAEKNSFKYAKTDLSYKNSWKKNTPNGAKADAGERGTGKEDWSGGGLEWWRIGVMEDWSDGGLE